MPTANRRTLHLVLDIRAATFKGTQRLTCAFCKKVFMPNKDEQCFTTDIQHYVDNDWLVTCKTQGEANESTVLPGHLAGPTT